MKVRFYENSLGLFEEWRPTTRGNEYGIEYDRLFDEPDWLTHLMGKKWFNSFDFAKAMIRVMQRFGKDEWVQETEDGEPFDLEMDDGDGNNVVSIHE